MALDGDQVRELVQPNMTNLNYDAAAGRFGEEMGMMLKKAPGRHGGGGRRGRPPPPYLPILEALKRANIEDVRRARPQSHNTRNASQDVECQLHEHTDYLRELCDAPVFM